ncbi:TIR domain-containing protein [Acidovorax sp. SUPP2522]|uniref:hypothetical protein n=1 Tax=unclassified Acidovorax TaxID=2684926 RepID=UPI00234A7413|nr:MULTISPECIES: hypothetical protein [unclassified Acidovorax]WCM99726.1 hypothetical protein M5C96_10170 [Acidovorax sp. GBBC 1281]GKT14301.1 TIR domain-containing protein [Acidovorax sp. SUPP2522]
MFNLLVTADENGWSGQPTTFALSRCVREYTDAAITERLGSLDEASAAELMSIPSVFAYEEGVGKAPKFGRITGVSKRSNRMEVRVDYEFIHLPKFLTNEELWSMGAELDLGSWESSRTHWAVKDVDLARELLPKGVLLPAQFASQRQTTAGVPRVDITAHRFQVAFSFPGEYRALVEAVARETTALLGAHACFYDMNYQAQLARPGLDLLLQDLYAQRSRLLVVFIGADYQRKMWPNIEWSAIRAVMNVAKEKGRIMYVRMDDGAVEGVFPQDGFIDARRFTPAQIAAFIAERVEFTPGLPPV